MLVRRSTMERELAAEREGSRAAILDIARQYGAALARSEALQREISAWVANKAENITPAQAAQMFYAQNDDWQAEFFNTMQDQVRAHHDAMPPARPGGMPNPCAGVPAGEGQWWHAMRKLSDEGFETIEAMYEHAKHHREAGAA